MKQQSQKPLADAKDRLLASRAKEIRALREDVAGWQEGVRLASAFTALLALAYSGDEAARGGVTVKCEGESATVLVDKTALRAVLRDWQVESGGEGEQYRMIFRPSKA